MNTITAIFAPLAICLAMTAIPASADVTKEAIAKINTIRKQKGRKALSVWREGDVLRSAPVYASVLNRSGWDRVEYSEDETEAAFNARVDAKACDCR